MGWLEVAGERVLDGSRHGRWAVTIDRCGVVSVEQWCGSLSWPEVLAGVLPELARLDERV